MKKLVSQNALRQPNAIICAPTDLLLKNWCQSLLKSTLLVHSLWNRYTKGHSVYCFI